MRQIVVAFFVAATVIAPGVVQADPALNRAIGETLHNVKGNPGRAPDGPFNDRSHDCIGEKAVVALGEPRIRQLGITEQSVAKILGVTPLTQHGLTEAEVDGLLDAVDQCIPFQDIWVFLAMNARGTKKLIKNDKQRDDLASCLAETPGRQVVRDAWRVLFTQPQKSFQAAFSQMHGESMRCYARVFCGPAYVGAVITPGLFQTMITKGACPF